VYRSALSYQQFQPADTRATAGHTSPVTLRHTNLRLAVTRLVKLVSCCQILQRKDLNSLGGGLINLHRSHSQGVLPSGQFMAGRSA